MCEPQHFDFVDLNLDFLDLTPPAPTQGAPNVTKCVIPSLETESKLNIKKIDQSTGFRNNSKLQDLAKRIASSDLFVQQIQGLQEERNVLQQQLQELQSSANDVRRLYDEESQERKRLKCLSDKLSMKCDAQQKEITNKMLSCDQLESELENIKRVPIEYKELVQCFLRLCCSYDEEVKPLQKPQLDLVDKLKKYCREHFLKTPEIVKRSPKKRIRKPPKSESGIQCELWKMAPIPTACIAQLPKEMRSQGTQHISTTTTRSTCTSAFIKKHNVGTSFPEPPPLPPVNDIVIEMLKWDIRPLSPICDFIPDVRVEDEKLKTSTGTCTKLCNIQRSIDYVGVGHSLLSSIKRSNSRPPSRNMFDNFKHELTTPPPLSPAIAPFAANNFSHLGSMSGALSAATFEDLWQVFGQMLFGLLGNRPDTWSSAARSGNAQSQQEFYHWLRSLYADISEHQQQHQQPQQQQQQQQEQPLSEAEACINSLIPNEDNSSQHTSIATSPIRPISPSSGGICKIIIPSQARLEVLNADVPAPVITATDHLQAYNGLNDDNKELGQKNIVSEILKLFPSTEPTPETKNKLKKMLKIKRKRKRQQLRKIQKADDLETKRNTLTNSTPAKMELSTSVGNKLWEYSKSILAISPIKDRIPKEIEQQSEMGVDNFVFSPSKTKELHAESELQVDRRYSDILSPMKADDSENTEDDVKLEYDKNCAISPIEVLQNKTNKLWAKEENTEELQEDNTKEAFEENSYNSSIENEPIQIQTNERWIDNERSSVISCIEKNNIQDYEESAFSNHSLNEVSHNQADELWNENDRISVVSFRENENMVYIESDIKEDHDCHDLNKESQNEASELWNNNDDSTSTISCTDENNIEHREDDIKDGYDADSFIPCADYKVLQIQQNEHIPQEVNTDYEETFVIPIAENQVPQNQAYEFWNKNDRTSLISHSEKETIEYPENDIKDDYEETAFIPPIENEVTQNQQWDENGKTQILSYAKDKNIEQMAGEAYVATAFIPIPSNEVKDNQTNELKVENESAFLLPSLTETAVDFLSQLQISSYNISEKETPFIYDSPQSPADNSSLNQEFCENSMDNNESLTGYSAAHAAVHLAQDNKSQNSATTCLMTTLFGSVTESDSDDDIKDEFSAEEYKLQTYQQHTNQPSILINHSLDLDYKINDVEVESLNESQPEEKMDELSLIKGTPLNEADAHHIQPSFEEQIKEENLPEFKMPKSLQPIPPSPPHKNELPQWKLLQNQMKSQSFLIRQPMDSASKKYKKIESNDIQIPFVKQPNSIEMQAHDNQLEHSLPSLDAEEEKEEDEDDDNDVEVSLGYLENNTNDCNLVIDEDKCNTSVEYSQDNNSITDSTCSTSTLSDEELADNSNEQIEKINEAKRVKRKSEDVKIDNVQNNSTENYTKPTTFSASKLQSSPAKEIRNNLIKYEAATTVANSSNNNSDDDNFNNYLNNILKHVAPRKISPISIISKSISSATSVSVENDDVMNQPEPEPKKRGRKRKIAVCPNAAPTAAIACKRSERLRVKKSVDVTQLNATIVPLHAMATIKIGKYTTKHGDNDGTTHALLDSRANITVDAEKSSSVAANLDYYSDHSKARCDSPSAACEEKAKVDKPCKTQNMRQLSSRCNQTIGYQDIFQSFADQHRKCLQKKKPEDWAVIPPIQHTSKHELLKPYINFNCDKVKDESLMDHAAEQELESPASPTSFDSPASPSAADSFDTSIKPNVTKEIPLEPDPTRYEAQHSSLLQRLIINHSWNLHLLVVDTYNKKYSNSIQTQLCLRIKSFLTETVETDVESAAMQLVKDLLVITPNIKHITAVIVAEMQNVPRPEVELGCPLADVPVKYLGKQHRRISFVMRGLQQLQPNFTRELMGHIESTLFNYCTNEKLPLAAILNLTQLYLLTLSICMADMKKNPARLFVAKCLYYYNLKAVPMIYEVLCCFPTTLPHREERRYDRADALITVIQHLLMATKYDMDKHDLRIKELLSKLRFEYHFEPFQPQRSEVLNNLVEKVKADKLENVAYALALFCKRLPQPKVEADVLESQLMPLANEFYQIVTHSDSHDSRIACLLECISMVIKPFRMDTNIAIYMSLFSRFLNVVSRATPQEAAVRAIIRCQRFGYVNCYNELLNFKPCYELQPITKAMLETFVYRKSSKFWRNLNTATVNLTL